MFNFTQCCLKQDILSLYLPKVILPAPCLSLELQHELLHFQNILVEINWPEQQRPWQGLYSNRKTIVERVLLDSDISLQFEYLEFYQIKCLNWRK